ncbi:MAG: DUF1292 domain-containing protein [Halanaerobiales bacterium]
MAEEQGKFWIDEENNELVLEDAGGEERFYIEEEFDYEGNTYLVLIPAEENSDYEEDEALLLKLVENDGEDVLSLIEDDEEFERVRDYYLQR